VKRMVLAMLGAVAVNAAAANAQPVTTLPPGTPVTGGIPGIARAVTDAKQLRYQIGQMERVLEGAVEHGVSNIRDRLQAVGPTELLISDNARARGFRLEGYGVFFDVVVPSLDTTVLWSIRSLDQNDLGLERALKAVQAHIRKAGDVDLEQALRRIELQMNPLLLARAAAPAPPSPGGRSGAGSVAAAGIDAPAQKPLDSILSNPAEAYRAEVNQALMDALLDHSGSLGVEAGEWLTIAARRNDERPRLAPADTDAQTVIIRLRGSDLAAFLARQISREEALKRVEVRVF
jgi:hypothetical protein